MKTALFSHTLMPILEMTSTYYMRSIGNASLHIVCLVLDAVAICLGLAKNSSRCLVFNDPLCSLFICPHFSDQAGSLQGSNNNLFAVCKRQTDLTFPSSVYGLV